MVTVVIRILCTKGSVPDRSAHSIGILGRTVLYFCGDFISGSSRTASGYKGIRGIYGKLRRRKKESIKKKQKSEEKERGERKKEQENRIEALHLFLF